MERSYNVRSKAGFCFTSFSNSIQCFVFIKMILGFTLQINISNLQQVKTFKQQLFCEPRNNCKYCTNSMQNTFRVQRHLYSLTIK